MLRKGNNKKMARIGYLSKWIGMLLLSVSLSISAKPQGGQVISGQVTITEPTATSTYIHQTTQQGIINWQEFGIEANEQVHFEQPNTSSITLNRVVGNNPSHIFGQLTATGQVMLINRSGILFGRQSQVDVGGLIATTPDRIKVNFLENNDSK